MASIFGRSIEDLWTYNVLVTLRLLLNFLCIYKDFKNIYVSNAQLLTKSIVLNHVITCGKFQNC